MNHYSQGNEQEFILEFFKGKTDGFFLDVGAGDGWNDSNTRALWDLGWSGMLIEANYKAFKQLMEVYGSGERAILLYAAVNTVNGLVRFWEHSESGWSSLDPKYYGEKKEYQPRWVQGLRLDALNIGSVDFLTIDVEGLEADILATLPETMNPSLIMAEADKPGTAWGIGMILIKQGYQEIWHNSGNVAYAKGR